MTAKFNQAQYALLMKCSMKKDMTEWNKYIRETDNIGNRSVVTRANLKGADLSDTDLKGANLERANLDDANLDGAILAGANLSRATLHRTQFCGADLKGINFETAIFYKPNLIDANLEGANLNDAKLYGARFISANLDGAKLLKVDLRDAILHQADFSRANLDGADLEGADLSEANFSGANLSNTNLSGAKLIQINLNEANISGAKLYGTSRDNWIIDDIKCDYIYLDINKTERTPKDRNFNFGEFEALHKDLPEIKYYFSDDFTPITPLIMDKVVSSINKKYPHFELILDSFHSRGTPHAVFTVLHKEYTDKALKEIKKGYDKTILKLEGKLEAFQYIINKFMDRPSIVIEHMGDKFGDIHSGRDTNIITENGHMNIVNKT